MKEQNESKAHRIFMQSLDVEDAQEREKWIKEACGDDEKLLTRVTELLTASDKAGGFLATKEDDGFDLDIDLPDDNPVREGSGSRIGPYKLLQEIGTGGMGVVFMAEQEEPVVRRVALKIIKLGMDTKQVVARFEAERQALAMMDHPNIARVLDAGTTDTGRPYFVMELVKGVPIDEYCDHNHLTPKDRLDLFLPVCNAVQHAHLKGIIHRDIKPSNVMVTLHDGVPVPKVIDFGIAKATNQKLTEKTLFTNYGQMVGTPTYMSPEQAEMSGLDIDTRTDVYSLGVLLYKLLTGTTPFDEKDLLGKGYGEMQRMIKEQDPPKPSTRASTLTGESLTTISRNRSLDPRSFNQSMKGDLDWIVMKALEKDRNRRYESASAMAADLRRHLADEPIEAGAPGAIVHLTKFVRRHRTMVGTLAAIFVVTLVGAVVSTLSYLRAEELRKQAEAAGTQLALQLSETEEARNAEAKARETAKSLLYVSDMNLAMQAWRNGDTRQAVSALETHRPEPGQVDLRGFEWRHLWQLSHGEILDLKHEVSNGVGDGSRNRFGYFKAVLTSTGDRLVTAGSDGVILWEADSGRRLAEWEAPHRNLLAAAFSKDGRRIQLIVPSSEKFSMEQFMKTYLRVLEGKTVEVSIRNLYRYLEVFECEMRAGSEWSRIPFSEAETGAFAARMLPGGQGSGGKEPWMMAPLVIGARLFSPWSLATTPDGKRIILGGIGQTVPRNSIPDPHDIESTFNGMAVVWDTEKDEAIHVFDGLPSFCVTTAISADGRNAAVANAFGGQIVLFDLYSGGSENREMRVQGTPYWIEFMDGRNQIYAGMQGGRVEVRDLATLELVHSFQTQSAAKPDFDVSITPGGDLVLASASEDRSVKVWDPDLPSGVGEVFMEARLVLASMPSADSRMLVGLDQKGNLLHVDLKDRELIETPSIMERLDSKGPSISMGAVSPSGVVAVMGTGSGKLNVLKSAADPEPLALEGMELRPRKVVLSHDGQLVAASFSGMPGVRVWNAATGDQLGELSGLTNEVVNFSFTPDGGKLVTCSLNQEVHVWSSDTLSLVRTWNDAGVALAMEIFQDGRHMAVAGTRVIRVWDIDTGEKVLQTPRFGANIIGLAVHPNGRRLAVSTLNESQTAELKIWDLEENREVLTLDRTRGGLFNHLNFTPDGNQLVAWLAETAESNLFGSKKMRLKIWDASPQALRGLLEGAGVDPDDSGK